MRGKSYSKRFARFADGAKVMLTVNLDMQDHLINGQMGNISYTEFA